MFPTWLDLVSSLDGLSGSLEDTEYLIKYKNNLLGRQFKFIQQLTVFHLHRDMCSDIFFDLWKATGELGALTHRLEVLGEQVGSSLYSRVRSTRPTWI